MERRLAAILAADVAGYSRLIGADDAATIAALRDHHAAILPMVGAHGGRVVDTAGDSILAEFPSAVGAVGCAVAIQEAVALRNETVPVERRMAFRIGINQGEIAAEGDRLYGDGLNSAARLQTLAVPGGIAVSDRVHEDIAGKLALAWSDAGEHRLKNIARPVRVYMFAPEGRAAPPAAATAAEPVPIRQPRIAVKPFEMLGAEPARSHLGSGVTEDIVTELARFRTLQVVSYDPALERSGEPGADYLVRGSLRLGGGKIRISAQLIDTASGATVWSERYDHDEAEIFDVLDTVVRTVVATLTGRITSARTDTAKRKPPGSLAAFEWYLRGNAMAIDDPEGLAQAASHYAKAVALDPGYASARALLAVCRCQAWFLDMTADDGPVREALDEAKAAAALDPNEPMCQSALGFIHLQLKDYDLAVYHHERAYDLNPNRPATLTALAELNIALGDARRALDQLQTARRLDPFFEPSFYWPLVGMAHFFLGEPEAAAVALLKSRISPYWVHAYRAAALAEAGRLEEAASTAAELVRTCPAFSTARFVAREPHRPDAYRSRLAEALRAAGAPE